MALELVTGAFINVLFERVIPRDFIEFFRSRQMDKGLLGRLERSLNSICKVLDDAEDKQITCDRITNWLDDLRDAAYRADDLLGEFHYKMTKSKVEAEQHTRDALAVENCSKKQLKRNFWRLKYVFRKGDSTTGVKFSKSQQERMKEIVNTLENLVKQKGVLGLKDDDKKYASPKREPMTSLVKESDVFGRNEDKEEIIKLLLVNDDRSEIGVIRIVGMGGIGKTTLAQLVYSDSRTKELFETRAWVCVSDNYDGFRVKGDILKQISKCGAYDQLIPERIDHFTPNDIDEELMKILKDKKYLVVLDDMWHDNSIDWDRLLAPFKWGANGSKIIVTARDQSVASTVSVSTPYLLRNLEEEYCWQLFEKHAFNGENVDQRFVDTGREIVKKCKGSPLAVKMLGNQLRGERRIQEWMRILKNNVWASQNDNVLSALRLSYQRLPPRLKQCFSYLAIFPKDYVMSKEQIIHLWVAEGFLEQSEGGREMEELGEKCLYDLVSRSFLQETYHWTRKQCFCMHDLINDLPKLISGNFVARMEVDSSSQISPRNRHLSYLAGTVHVSSIDEAISKPQALRTFLTSDWDWGSDWVWGSDSDSDSDSDCDIRNQREVDALLHDGISKLLCLRVLSLHGVEHVEKLLDLLGNLKQLRYLDLSHTKLERLPESVCTCYNLQILLLYDCRKLVELPKHLRRLINLRCLDIRDTPLLQVMPQGMGNLKELKTLPKFYVGKQNGAKIDDLVELQHLQEISIFNLQNVMETPRDVLMNKENLDNLKLEWNGETTDSEHGSVLEKLKPCTSIKILTIRGYGGTKFADWVGDSSYSNIVSMLLEGCKYCTVLPTLGQLRFLEYLSIKEFDAVRNVGVEFCKSSSMSMEVPFSSLKTLHIEDMRQWEDWVICDSINCKWFPKLKELTIRNCPKLKSISTCEPTHKIFKSLYQLNVDGCPYLKTSDLLAVSSFKNLAMSLKDHEVVTEKLRSGMYHLKIQQRCRCSEEYNPRMEGNEEMMILFKALDFEEIEIRSSRLLQSIPLEVLPYLRHLTVSHCDKLESLSASEDPHHLPVDASLEIKFRPNLTSITLWNCSNLKSLPQDMHNRFQSLKRLKISECGKIESFPGGLPSNLKSLKISGCDDKLIGGRLQWGLQKLNALSHLKLDSYEGDDLDYFPEQTLLPSSLTTLEIRGFSNLKFINYQGLQHLTSLSVLSIKECPKIESFPEEGLPSNLQTLHISGCDQLIGGRLNWGLERFHALSNLFLSSYKGDGLNSFPEQKLLPHTLRYLRIFSFKNLKLINHEGLQHLTSLDRLEIYFCYKLESLPEGFPSSLSVLQIRKCPLLEKRCERDKGEDWPKISHITTIQINSKTI